MPPPYLPATVTLKVEIPGTALISTSIQLPTSPFDTFPTARSPSYRISRPHLSGIYATEPSYGTRPGGSYEVHMTLLELAILIISILILLILLFWLMITLVGLMLAAIRKKAAREGSGSWTNRIFGTGRTGLDEHERGRANKLAMLIETVIRKNNERHERASGGNINDANIENGANSSHIRSGLGASERGFWAQSGPERDRLLNEGAGTGRAMSSRGLFGMRKDEYDRTGDTRRRSGGAGA